MKTSAQVPIPQWHLDILMERQRLVADGKARYIPWAQAKKEIVEEIARGRSQHLPKRRPRR